MTIRSLVQLVSIFVVLLTDSCLGQVTITSGSFCYSVAGDTCDGTGVLSTAFRFRAGETTTVTANTACPGGADHPLVICTSSSTSTQYSGASPQNQCGGSTITVTIPAVGYPTTLYMVCNVHLFYRTIAVDPPLVSSSSSSTAGGGGGAASNSSSSTAAGGGGGVSSSSTAAGGGGGVSSSSSTAASGGGGGTSSSSSTGGTVATHTIDGTQCFGFSLDGSACVSNGGPALTLSPGTTTVFQIISSATHPVCIQTDTILPAHSYSGAVNAGTLNSAGCVETGTITLTLPSTGYPSSLRYICSVHDFSGVINIVGTPTSSSAGGLSDAQSLRPSILFSFVLLLLCVLTLTYGN